MSRRRTTLRLFAVLAAVVLAKGCRDGAGPAEPAFPTPFTVSLEKTAGDGQHALAGSLLPVRPTVLVRDANGHVIDDATVSFRVTEGGGSAEPEIAVAESGRASTEWALGAAGHQALVAYTADASVEFTATSFLADDPQFCGHHDQISFRCIPVIRACGHAGSRRRSPPLHLGAGCRGASRGADAYGGRGDPGPTAVRRKIELHGARDGRGGD